MKTRVIVSTAAMLACAAVLSAQTQAPAAPGSAPAKAPAGVTLQGCIERNPASSSATPGSTGTSGGTTAFILTSAKGPASASEAKGTSGSAGAAAAPTASSYRLVADDSTLSAHIGHRVEVTGSVEEQSSSASASGASASAASMPRFKVDNVKMIAAACTVQ